MKYIYSFIILFFLSSTLFSQNKIKQPVTKVSSGVKKSPNADLDLKTGDEYYNLYKYKEALTAYLNAYNGNHEKKFYLIQQIAHLYKQLYDYKNALEWYAWLFIYLTDNSAENLFDYAQLLKSNQQYEKAIKIFSEYCKKSNQDMLYADAFEASCYWAKENANVTPKYVIYPTTIETGGRHLGMDYYNDGLITSLPVSSEFKEKTVYYNLAFVKNRDTTHFNPPQKINGELDAPYYEAGPSISPDGKRVFYTRNSTDDAVYKTKKINKYKVDKKGSANLQLYSATNDAGVWSKGHALNINNLNFNCVFPCVSKDGKTLYFCSNMPGGFGGYDVYKASIINDSTVSKPENLGAEINTDRDELYPSVTKAHFYYSSNGKNGFGGLDIQQASFLNDKIVNSVNMGIPFNSPKDDFSIILKENEKEGYFATNRTGEHGGDKIYYFKKLPVWDTLRGTIIDKITGHPLEKVKVDLFEMDDNGNKTFLRSTYTDKNGKWLFVTDPEKAYLVSFDLNDYDSKKIKIPKNDGNTDVSPSHKEVLAALEPMTISPTPKKNNIVKIDNIYFDFDKATIRPESFLILNNLVSYLNEAPDAHIELSAHTDAVGDDKYNMKLSDARAKSCYDYLITKGINASRLVPKGYGETKLLNGCTNNKRCTDAENQINRRVEIKFL